MVLVLEIFYLYQMCLLEVLKSLLILDLVFFKNQNYNQTTNARDKAQPIYDDQNPKILPNY